MVELSVPAAPPIHGLVLAGGHSQRMGRDKGLLDYAGTTAVARAWRTLDAVCAATVVSVRADQTTAYEATGLPLVVDSPAEHGPIAGLLAAWRRDSGCALLALAVDLPRVDPAILTELIGAREAEKTATAFRHPDGTLEPLCAIWEPRARAVLRERAAAGRFSLREVLDTEPVKAVEPGAIEHLESVNTPGQYQRIRGILCETLRTR